MHSGKYTDDLHECSYYMEDLKHTGSRAAIVKGHSMLLADFEAAWTMDYVCMQSMQLLKYESMYLYIARCGSGGPP